MNKPIWLQIRAEKSSKPAKKNIREKPADQLRWLRDRHKVSFRALFLDCQKNCQKNCKPNCKQNAFADTYTLYHRYLIVYLLEIGFHTQESRTQPVSLIADDHRYSTSYSTERSNGATTFRRNCDRWTVWPNQVRSKSAIKVGDQIWCVQIRCVCDQFA